MCGTVVMNGESREVEWWWRWYSWHFAHAHHIWYLFCAVLKVDNICKFIVILRVSYAVTVIW